jgi:predicted GNAT family N-acyltransferase
MGIPGQDRGVVEAVDAVELRWAAGPDEVRGALDVRNEVFCREQGVPRTEELDSHDEEALHLVGLAPGGRRVVATLRLLRSDGLAKIGRVAVERDWRRRGIASQMLEMALADAREHGCEHARLAAQIQATGLYERAGFTIESEPFLDAGIPHVWMGLRL